MISISLQTDKADIPIHWKEGLPKPAANVAPGDIKYKDMNNDGSIDANDMSYRNGLYPNNPQIVYGFGLNIDYKGFFAGIFFQGVAKASTNLLAKTSNFIPFYNGVDSSSARAEAMNRWTAADPFNQNVMYPRTHANRFTPQQRSKHMVVSRRQLLASEERGGRVSI